MKYALRDSSGNPTYRGTSVPVLRHSICARAGLRPALGQHTAAEHAALKRWADGASTLVEIGVAEGVSARALREGMKGDGRLFLIDPFHLSRVRALNFMKRVAMRNVRAGGRGKVIWIQEFSQEAVNGWNEAIDLLFIDGDHDEEAVERDWRAWSPFLSLAVWRSFMMLVFSVAGGPHLNTGQLGLPTVSSVAERLLAGG